MAAVGIANRTSRADERCLLYSLCIPGPQTVERARASERYHPWPTPSQHANTECENRQPSLPLPFIPFVAVESLAEELTFGATVGQHAAGHCVDFQADGGES